MKDDRKIKTVMLGDIQEKGRKGRPYREWLDDIEAWCGKDIYFLNREDWEMEEKDEMFSGHLLTYT